MKIILLKDVPKVGMAGDVVDATEGHARNFLIPRKLAAEATKEVEEQYKRRMQSQKRSKDVIETETSMMAEKIRHMKITVKQKMHPSGKLYGALDAALIVAELRKLGVSVVKNKILFSKAIKSQGEHRVTVKLTARLQPELIVTVASE